MITETLINRAYKPRNDRIKPKIDNREAYNHRKYQLIYNFLY